MAMAEVRAIESVLRARLSAVRRSLRHLNMRHSFLLKQSGIGAVLALVESLLVEVVETIEGKNHGR